MRRILAGAAVVVAVGAFAVLTLGASHGQPGNRYRIEIDNAFGLVTGSDFKVAGVPVGSVKSIDLDPKTLHALITVGVSQKGFGQFHQDVFCQSRPQSLIGEYFIDCEPGNQGPVWPSSRIIPASHTRSTIPADLVQNIMRLPYRQRFTILLNELGAAVAARSEDIQTALRRADPALAETDNLLKLLADDAHTIQQLNVNADQVITALAKGSNQVQSFVDQGNNAARASATQAAAITATWQKLPAFLEQLQPALQKLGAAADAQDPVLVNLNSAATNLKRFFTDLVPFSHESVPSLKSLGQASKVGIPAVQAASPTVSDLTRFAKPTPELAQNLAIVLHDLNDRSRAVEPDPRSPNGGRGYSGLEGLLQYVFNIANAVSYFSTWGHLLGVDAYVDSLCAPYATPQTIANNIDKYVKNGGDLKSYGSSASPAGLNPRSCYAFLGPQQPGVTVPDPSFNAKLAASLPGQPNGTNGCVPDPGGYPVLPPQYGVKYYGAKTSACKLAGLSSPAADKSSATASTATVKPKPRAAATGPPGPRAAKPDQTGSSLGASLGAILTQIGSTLNQTVPAPVRKGAPSRGGASGAASQAQRLLNYLLAP